MILFIFISILQDANLCLLCSIKIYPFRDNDTDLHNTYSIYLYICNGFPIYTWTSHRIVTHWNLILQSIHLPLHPQNTPWLARLIHWNFLFELVSSATFVPVLLLHLQPMSALASNANINPKIRWNNFKNVTKLSLEIVTMSSY